MSQKPPSQARDHLLSDSCLKALQRYQTADRELLRLEDQLDFVIHCSRNVRDRKVELAQRYAESSENERTPEGVARATEAYLDLLNKGKALDDELAMLKEECADARNTCSWLYVDLKRFPDLPGQNIGENIILSRLRVEDHDGVVDKQAAIKKIYEGLVMAVNVGTAVGALGAGVTFSTIFSATRGRLDLMAWAFTCFLSVVFCCAVYQTSARQLPRVLAGGVLAHFPAAAARRWLYYPLWAAVVTPLAAGLALLAVAVGTLGDPADSAGGGVEGSRTATRVAGYVTLAWLAALLASLGVSPRRLVALLSRTRYPVPLPRDDSPAAPEAGAAAPGGLGLYPSHMLPPDSRWEFLPGGAEYSVYRRWRRHHNKLDNLS